MTAPATTTSGPVQTYLAAIVAHDWEALRASLHPDVVRVGPFGDRYEGRDAYVAHLTALMPTLEGYAMELHRVTYSGSRAFAELTEHVAGTVTNEVIIVDLDDDQLVTGVEIFTARG